MTGLVSDASEGIPDDLLTKSTTGKVRVDVWPLSGGPCPAKEGGIIIGPTLVPVSVASVLPLLQEKQRGYHAYIRHLDLTSFPEVAARLPLTRAKRLCGPRIKSANLWLGDGRVQSAVHWDGHDNLLLQLEGRKQVLLLPPDAVGALGFRRFKYHAWCLEDDEVASISQGACLAPQFADHAHCKADVDNHCTFDAFSATADVPLEIRRRAFLATLEPGQALFVPALWHHAVASEPDPASGLNCAANLWFVLGTAAHDAALERTPHWPEALFCLASCKRSLGDPLAAVDVYERALRLRPGMTDAQHNLATALAEAGDLQGAAARFEANAGTDAAGEARRLSGLGVVYKRQGRLEAASKAFDASIRLVGDARTMSYRGNVAALLGDLPDAEARLAEAAAAATKPRDKADALNSRGVVLEALGRRADAADCYDRALAAVPGHAKARANRDALREGSGD